MTDLALRERRVHRRTTTTLRGKVYPDGVDCTVADLSRRGARLTFQGPPPAGDAIIFVILTTGFAYVSEARWRKASELGVEFRRGVDLRYRVPPHLADAKAQWMAWRRPLNRTKLKKCAAIDGYKGSPLGVRIN